jgi:hypothetical protein
VSSCCHYLKTNKTNNNVIIFLGHFLKQVKTHSYCNIGNIIDLKSTNLFLTKYNISLVDIFDYSFKITSIKYGILNYVLDFSHFADIFESFSLEINKGKCLNDYKGDPLLFFARQFGIPLNKNQQRKLCIQYTINDLVYEEQYDVSREGFLLGQINLDFKKLQPVICHVHNDGSFLFYDILRNIVFQKVFIQKADFYLRFLQPATKVNCIHLRLESDAMEAWGSINGKTVESYKQLVEDKYIKYIKKYLPDKNDLIIVLAHDFDNAVIRYLEENKYHYELTPKFYEEREMSAIVDLQIGQACNNVCLCVFESTFSFALCTRVKDKSNFKNYLVCLTDLDNENEMTFIVKQKEEEEKKNLLSQIK